MKQERNQTLLLGLLSGAVSIAGLVWVILRWQTKPAPVTQAESAPLEERRLQSIAPVPDVVTEMEQPSTRVVRRPTLLRLAAALGGLVCLTAMQVRLLESRQPLLPLVLFGLGVVLLQPMYAYFESRWLASPPEPSPVWNKPPGVRNRVLYWAGGCFFGLIAAALTITGFAGSLRIISWLLAVFALSWAILNGERLRPDAWPQRRELALVIALSLAAAGLQVFTPGTTSTPHIILVSAAVMAVYMLGRAWMDVPLAGVVAALAFASGWLLVLGKTAVWEVALVSLGALYVLTLLHLPQRKAVVGTGLVLGLGILVNSAFILTGVLLPVRLLLWWLDDRRASRWTLLSDLLVIVLLTLVVMIPGLPLVDRFIGELPQSAIIGEDETPPPANPQLSLLDGLAISLLMFNLASDPNVLHGIVWRPAFGPLTGAALMIGVMGNAWLLHVRRRWQDAFLLAALVCLLLPAAANFALPVRYPDLLRAAGALPVALVLAGYGVVLIGRLLVARLNRVGWVLALLLLVGGMALTLLDWQQHYRQVYIPLITEMRIQDEFAES